MFQSSISFGSGKTTCLEKNDCDGITYLDTPGLGDVKLWQIAAKEITVVLKQNGRYHNFFVLTLSSGKVRSEDFVTI